MSNLKVNRDNKLDKIRFYYLEGKRLNKTQDEMREKYEEVNSLLCTGYSRENAVSVLRKKYNLRPSQAYQIIRDTIHLFGDIADSNRKGLKHIMYENYMLASNLARKAGDYNAMIRALENAEAIYKDDLNTSEDLVALFKLSISRTTDPKALEQSTIDTTYEEPIE